MRWRSFALVGTLVGCGALYGVHDGEHSRSARLALSPYGSGWSLGTSVALSFDGATLLAGAPATTTPANGSGAGAAFVFEWDGAMWKQITELDATTPMPAASFGNSVAMSPDAGTFVIGAAGESDSAGAVYVFPKSGGGWGPGHRLTASDAHRCDHFGSWVAISRDATTIAVSATNQGNTNAAGPCLDPDPTGSGAVYVYTRSGGTWSQVNELHAPTPQPASWFGFGLALDGSGGQFVVGAPLEDTSAGSDSGAVYLLGVTGAGSTRVLAPNARAGDHFGAFVALTPDGATLTAGATQEASAAIGIGGDDNDTSQPNTGAAYIFKPPSQPNPIYVKPTIADYGDRFAKFISLSDDGNTLVVSHWAANAVEVYRADPTWRPVKRIAGGGGSDAWGWDVQLSGDGSTIAAPAPGENGSSGAVYILDTP